MMGILSFIGYIALFTALTYIGKPKSR